MMARETNIVYVLVDDMGYGDVSCLNPEGRIKTPNIDRLAREGMVFTDAHSSSAVCSPSRYSVLTGRYHLREDYPDESSRYDQQCLPALCTWGNTLLTAAASAIPPDNTKCRRERGIIGFSDDRGVTWRHRLIDEGEFDYATMGRVGDKGVIVMFSRGGHGPNGSFLRAFTMDWLREA